MRHALGEFEQLILLAVVRLGGDAYGVRMRQEIESRTGRTVSAGAIYTALERLESRGLVASTLGDANPQRRGRPRKYYRLEPSGADALSRSYTALSRMAEGIGADLDRLREDGGG